MSFKGIFSDDSHICQVCRSCRLFDECCLDSDVVFCPISDSGFCADCPVSESERCKYFLPVTVSEGPFWCT